MFKIYTKNKNFLTFFILERDIIDDISVFMQFL